MEVCRLCLPFVENIYIYIRTHTLWNSSVYMYTVQYVLYICDIWNYTIHINVYIYIYICGCFKQKPEAQAIFFNLFAHHSNGSLSFVCWLMKKQMEVIRLKMDKTDFPINACQRGTIAFRELRLGTGSSLRSGQSFKTTTFSTFPKITQIVSKTIFPSGFRSFPDSCFWKIFYIRVWSSEFSPKRVQICCSIKSSRIWT